MNKIQKVMSKIKQVFWLRGRSPAKPSRYLSSSGLQAIYVTALKAFVSRYSGVTAQDLNLFPYSPQTVVRGT